MITMCLWKGQIKTILNKIIDIEISTLVSRSSNILLRYPKMKYTPKCIYENTPILFNLLLFYFMHPKCIDNIISKRNGFQSSHKMTKWLIKRHNSHKATHHLSFEIAQNQKNKNFANCVFKKRLLIYVSKNFNCRKLVSTFCMVYPFI